MSKDSTPNINIIVLLEYLNGFYYLKNFKILIHINKK